MKLKLTVDGKLYEVDVEVAESQTPQPSYVPPLGQAYGSGGAASAAGAPQAKRDAPAAGDEKVDERRVCRSPISGVVVRVSAKVGQQLKVNDEIMVLEAMKMETVITSPIAGTISRLDLQPGDAVKGNQVLVVFE